LRGHFKTLPDKGEKIKSGKNLDDNCILIKKAKNKKILEDIL